eukprot:GEMP01012268.1.p1 GENE.GEMP01012268.1~~GEMP01012268.1.p1  ORF type:complete len:749 (-),score=146.15 GEMP01012268.1:787-3033(-)
MAYQVKVATCNLNQWALDFDGNKERIRESIIIAKKAGARFRTGPELEITGYSCEDHFVEYDTLMHAWEVIAEFLQDRTLTMDILCDIGMPVVHRNVLYNCRVFILNRRILGIRPKMYLASDGNYREARWFTAWPVGSQDFGPVHDFPVPVCIQKIIPGHPVVPIGIIALQTHDTVIASETCEELFVPNNPNIAFGLDGVEIIANGSGSHHELRKLSQRIDLIKGATTKGGGVYLYANQKGCDGGRLFFDGSCMVWVNGQLVGQGSQFGLQEVEVVTAVVNLEDVRSMRTHFQSRSAQAANAPKIHRVAVDFVLGPCSEVESRKVTPFVHTPMEEIALGPSAWLWDYLRRSGMRGYFLPLSGGADSASTCTLVGIMCRRVFDAFQTDPLMLADLRRIVKDPQYQPKSAEEICGKIMFSCYMASEYSGDATRQRAVKLAEALGVTHSSIFIDGITEAVQSSFKTMKLETNTHQEPLQRDAKMEGGTMSENLALQNIQARSRMVMSYFLAQLMPWAVQKDGNPYPGSLLVLGSSNVDEALRGYYTKYDCSAADINPIGGIRKSDLRDFLLYSAKTYNLPILQAVAEAVPSAELSGQEGVQSDEKDMGMSYDELGDLGYIRKVEHAGPLRTFEKVRAKWVAEDHKVTLSKRGNPEGYNEEVAQKVKDFYHYHNLNRHKMTTLTPSYHAENYGPEDNRFDLRPFLYPPLKHQFNAVDKRVAELSSCSKPGALPSAAHNDRASIKSTSTFMGQQ